MTNIVSNNDMKTNANFEQINTCVDLHVHGGASSYIDNFATASIYDVCSYFSDFAKRNNIKKMFFALTDHNTIGTIDTINNPKSQDYKEQRKMTYELYEKLKEEFPNLEPVLGIEANCNLMCVTDNVFKKAHITAYADMSSEAGIKKWLESEELQSFSKIKTFQMNHPRLSNENIVKNVLNALGDNYGIKLNYVDEKNIIKKFQNTSHNAVNLKKEFLSVSIPVLKKYSNFDFCKSEKELEDVLNSLKFGEYASEDFPIVHFKPSFGVFGNMEKGVKLAVAHFNSQCEGCLDYGTVKSKIDFSQSPEQIDMQFLKIIAEQIASAPINTATQHIIKRLGIKISSKNKVASKDVFKSLCEHAHLQASEKSKSFDDMFETETFDEFFGARLFTARNLINDQLRCNISLVDVAKILDENKSRDKMLQEFLVLAYQNLIFNHKSLKNKVASLFDAQMFFEYYTFDLYERKGNLFNVLPLQPMMGEPSLYQKINFDEFYKMVKKAGGYVCLAHPSCSFSFSEEGKLTNADFQKIDMSCLSSQEVKDIIVELSASGGVRINHSKVKNNIMLKLELLNEKLKQNDIKLDGIEVNVSILRQPLLRRSVLHFVAKNDMDISYGTDTHLSILHESFAKFHTGQISGPEYGALKDYARMLGDKTLPESYKRGYLKQTTKTVKLCKLDSAKDDNELQYTYLVNNVSLLNKIFNTKNNDVLLEHTTHLEHSPNFSNNYDAMQDESANVVLHHKHICTKQDALEYQYHNTPRIQYSKTQSHLLGINAQPSKKSVKNSKSKKQREIEKQKEKEKIEKRKKHSLKEKLKKEKRKENKKNKHKGSNHKDELSM